MSLIKSVVGGFRNKVYKTKGGIWAMGHVADKHRNVLAVVRGPEGKLLVPASNIVTDAGDIFYAQMGADETPTNAFGVQIMATAGTPGKAATDDTFTQIAGSEKAHDGTYPQADDSDGDNTGAAADVCTYLTSWTTGDFNDAAISHGIITNASPGATEPILCGYAFAAPFAKTASDTLKVFVNHNMNGV